MYENAVILLGKACVLVTLTFVLTRTRWFISLLRPRLPARDQRAATLVFLVMGFAEVAVTQQQNLLNLRVVAVCAAGLLAGPWVGLIVGVAVTGMAYDLQPVHYAPIAVGISMMAAGLVAGMIRQRNPRLAVRPMTGFVLGASTSIFRYFLALGFYPILHTYAPAQPLPDELASGLFHGLSVALILLVVDQVRKQEAQAHAAAMSEVRALQARMDPHFLFNSLNTLTALSTIDPRAIPKAAARLGVFLRASLDCHERPFIALREEMDVVGAYLGMEALRFGDRLTVEQHIDADVLDAPVPPFLLQPLVENAVRHGIQPRPEGGRIDIRASSERSWLTITVSDTGIGIAPGDTERLFSEGGGHVHALALLRRRLAGLYGSDYRIDVESEPGKGTGIYLRIPLGLSRLLEDGPLGPQLAWREAEEPAELIPR